jgi:hypothetical protein
MVCVARTQTARAASERRDPGPDPSRKGLNMSIRHAWTLTRDLPNKRFVWACTCGHTVDQPFGTAVPDDLVSHPQEHGQMRGE